LVERQVVVLDVTGSNPVARPTGVPPGAKSLRGTRILVLRSDFAAGGTPVKPLGFPLL